MKKGKIKDEPINVIAFCGDGGGADMGLAAISAALTDVEYNLLIFLYDNEAYANTDIQTSGQTPWGAVTTFSPPGKKHRIMQRRWKKNVPGMLAAGTPTPSTSPRAPAIPVDMMDKVRAALSVGGPTYMHVLDPCPKGWHYDPEHSNELGKLAIETGIYPLYEIKEGVLKLTGVTKQIAEGKRMRKPVREYLEKQGRFAHFKNQDYTYFQKKVDEMWEQWVIPTVVAFSYGGPINITSDMPKVRNRNVERENASWVASRATPTRSSRRSPTSPTSPGATTTRWASTRRRSPPRASKGQSAKQAGERAGGGNPARSLFGSLETSSSRRNGSCPSSRTACTSTPAS